MRRPSDDDAGFSLAEVLVTMGVMSVLMLLFTGGILQVYKTTSATEKINEAQSELARGFQTFDRQLRYASWIATPGVVGNATYVEFAGPDDTDCYQLRLDASNPDKGVLALRTWTAGKLSAATTRVIASQILTTGTDKFSFVREDPGVRPFATASATPAPGASVGTDFTPSSQRLHIVLTTKAASGVSRFDTTFTALNTSNTTPATNQCSEGRPTT
jgi:prepilin-type N-terminal cleavage/methylation domain-containing protein